MLTGLCCSAIVRQAISTSRSKKWYRARLSWPISRGPSRESLRSSPRWLRRWQRQSLPLAHLLRPSLTISMYVGSLWDCIVYQANLVGDPQAQYSYTESQLHVRKQIILDKEETQNDRGIGPGRTSAVTSFVQKKGAMNASRSTSTTSISSKVSIKTGSQSLSRSHSSLSAGSGKGRLAKARLSKK